MNIVDILDNNHFIKTLYPNGLNRFFVGELCLSCTDSHDMILTIHSLEKPNKEISKWGKWGVNYDIIVIEFYGGGIRKANVKNWQNNNQEYCICKIENKDNFFNIKIEGSAWEIEIELSWLIPQNYKTYLGNVPDLAIPNQITD